MSGNRGDLSECLRCARLSLWIASPHGCVCLRLTHTAIRGTGARAEIKISRFWSFASISPIINGGGKGYTAETESLLSSLALE